MKKLFTVLGLVAFFASAPVAWAELNLNEKPPLFRAIESGDAKAVEETLLRDQDPNMADKKGRTPLIYAIASQRADIVQILLDHRANPHKADRSGNTPLYWAAEVGDAAVLQILLDKKVDVNKENKEGMTPLLAAVRANRSVVAEKLLMAGADPAHTDFTGRDAIAWAETTPNNQVLRLLKKE